METSRENKMFIKIQTRIISESVGGYMAQNIQDYVDPKDAVLGLAHQLGFIIKKSDVKPQKRKEKK